MEEHEHGEGREGRDGQKTSVGDRGHEGRARRDIGERGRDQSSRQESEGGCRKRWGPWGGAEDKGRRDEGRTPRYDQRQRDAEAGGRDPERRGRGMEGREFRALWEARGDAEEGGEGRQEGGG